MARKDNIRLCRDDEIVAFTNTSIQRTVTVFWPSLTDLLGFLLSVRMMSSSNGKQGAGGEADGIQFNSVLSLR